MIFFVIKINFEGDDDFYIHHDTGGCGGDMSPILFLTKEEAEKYAEPWKEKMPPGFVTIEKYMV